MPSQINYTTRARQIAYRFPRLSFIGIQVNFWVVAILLYSGVTYLNTLYLEQIQPLLYPPSLPLMLISGVIIGVLLGITLGFIDLLMTRLGSERLSFGLVILLRMIIYPLVLFCIVSFGRFYVADWIDSLFKTDYSGIFDSPETWLYFYWSLLIYITLMSAIISFINQMNSKFGPGILIPMLLGRYRKPREQKRFFMFLDMKSSTQHAEELGHLKFSALIRDCFADLNHVLTLNTAEVYQYVGDEAVISWQASEGIHNMACISMFFDFKERLKKKSDYYQKNYCLVPEFKAGLHFGLVTAVEVGEVKREIAYHGDTINTAARIQAICNEYSKSFLISDSVKELFDDMKNYMINPLGKIALKGKHQQVEIFSVDL